MFRAIIVSALLLYQSAGGTTIFAPKPQPVEQVIAAEEEFVLEISEETSNIELKGVEEEVANYEPFAPKGAGHCELIKFADSDQVLKVYFYDRNKDSYNKIDGELFFYDLIDYCLQLDLDGIPLEAMLAQAYTEGGAGKQGVYRMSNNLFGIRAGANWDGYVYSRDLKKLFTDFRSAVAAGGRDLFRAYDDIEDSINDYVALVHSSALYKGALGKSTKRYLKHLVEHGYGSEDMVDVWLNVIKIYRLKGVGEK